MKRLLPILCISALLLLSCTQHEGYVAFRGYAQGGTYQVKVNLEGVKAQPKVIADTIDSLLVEIDGTLSGYNQGSLLSRFNRGETITPNEMFLDLYERSYSLYIESAGAFDVASGPLFDIWGFGFTGEEALPSAADVDTALEHSGMDRLKASIREAIRPDGTLCPSDLLVSDSKQHLPVLNFNAIAQGYSCDVIADYLHSLGVTDMLVDIGEIYCEGRNPNGESWTIGIDRPVDGNITPGADMQGLWRSDPLSRGQGVVTSGNYRKFYIRDGHKYSHTIDPRTGYPVQHSLLSATIIAPDATTADALATWCMVLGLEESEQLLHSLDLEGCLIYAESADSLQYYTTSGFGLEQK